MPNLVTLEAGPCLQAIADHLVHKTTHFKPTQELDEAQRRAALLQRERDTLARDYSLIKGQVEERSAHVMVLLDSNHRCVRGNAAACIH